MLLPHPFKKGLILGLTGLVLLSLVVLISLASLSPKRAAPHTKTLGISSTGSTSPKRAAPHTKTLGISSTGSTARAGLPATTTGTWSATGSMSTIRANHTATLLPNGKVLVAGGLASNSNAQNAVATAELYDPSTGTWSATGSMSTPRAWSTTTLLPNGRVLVAGGWGNSNMTTAELYDPSIGTWSATGSMSTHRSAHTATLLLNGKVLVVGGWNGADWLATAELYDPSTSTWSATGSMSTPRAWSTTTLLLNGKVLVVGGLGNDNKSALMTAELYDPSTGTWSATGSMSTPRSAHTTTLLPNGKVLVAGGWTNTAYLATAELYDPSTGTWSATGSMSTARGLHTATLLLNGKVLVAGGWTNTGALTTAELYDPSTGTWSATGSMSTPRYNHLAILLPDGKVLVAGGRGSNSYERDAIATAKLYTPTTDSSLQIDLDPSTEQVSFGNTVALIATVSTTAGSPLGGIPVTFRILTGEAHSGRVVTNSSGKAVFTFTDLSHRRTDTIQASFLDQGKTYLSNKASVTFTSSPINDAIGELVFQDPVTHNLHSCTGTVVESRNLSVVLTAAHCVYGRDPNDHQSKPHFYTNFTFMPGFSGDINSCLPHCKVPFGFWSSSKVIIDPFFAHNPDPSQGFDFAFLVMKRNGIVGSTPTRPIVGPIGRIVGGGLPIAFFSGYGQGWTAYGYPGTKQLVSCQDTSSEMANTFPGPYRFKMQCRMGEGASGGPWLNNLNNFNLGIGAVNSQTESCRLFCSPHMYGTYLGGEALTWFLVAEQA